jgi:hypothetical protein
VLGVARADAATAAETQQQMTAVLTTCADENTFPRFLRLAGRGREKVLGRERADEANETPGEGG